MQCFIDSNILIYLDLDRGRLSPAARDTISDSANELFLSVANLWELQIKIALGKLTLSRPLEDVVLDQWAANGIRLFSIKPPHIFKLASLPFHHSDPFDRLLIAQSLAEGMPVITSDPEFARYGVTVIW